LSRSMFSRSRDSMNIMEAVLRARLWNTEQQQSDGPNKNQHAGTFDHAGGFIWFYVNQINKLNFICVHLSQAEMRHCLCLMVSRLAVLSCLWCQRNPQVHAPEDIFLMVAWTSLLTCSSCQLHNHTVKEPPALYCITFTVCFALYCITHYTLHIIYSPCYTAVCRVTLIKM